MWLAWVVLILVLDGLFYLWWKLTPGSRLHIEIVYQWRLTGWIIGSGGMGRRPRKDD